jgi:hypothetical protein
LDFQLQKLMLALKMEIFGKELEIISSKERWDDIVVHVEVRGDASISDCCVGLTVVAVVVVEMQGDIISHQWEIWWRSQRWVCRVGRWRELPR